LECAADDYPDRTIGRWLIGPVKVLVDGIMIDEPRNGGQWIEVVEYSHSGIADVRENVRRCHYRKERTDESKQYQRTNNVAARDEAREIMYGCYINDELQNKQGEEERSVLPTQPDRRRRSLIEVKEGRVQRPAWKEEPCGFQEPREEIAEQRGLEPESIERQCCSNEQKSASHAEQKSWREQAR